MIRLFTMALLATVLWQATTTPPIALFVQTTSSDRRTADAALKQIAAAWKDGYAAIFIDLALLIGPPSSAPAEPDAPPLFGNDRDTTLPRRSLSDLPVVIDPGSSIRRRLLSFLGRQTGRGFGDNFDLWREWMWKLPYDPHPDYAAFKGLVYGQIDPRMRAFFPAKVPASIRLDEIDWGGVAVNGIPPLRDPPVVLAADAGYLKDSNVVFGLVANGEARAYPKRILAWHEMATDRVGGVDLAIVYCTLCGTVIPFESRAAGRSFRLGTSGLLYRSNKLMFDEETNSLWSTFEGVPVVGLLVGTGVKLQAHAVVTTTWKEWRTEHPQTTVLSLDTGYKRDYSEGAAYRDYFATDRLMFRVSKIDTRLRNKAEVLVLQLRDSKDQDRRVPVAIEAQFLRRHPVYSFTAASARFVVVTSPQGANRVYRAPVEFPEQRGGSTIADVSKRSWRVTETGLVLQSDSNVLASRVSAQRAFWFGWYAQFPDTILIK